MRGFTLLELIVVVTLIALLATLAGSNLMQQSVEAERKIALAKCREYYDATWSWMLFQRAARAPEHLSRVAAPLRDGERNFIRLEQDPWGQQFRLERETGRNFRIWSNGPDAEPGTDDDICYEPLDEA